MTNSYIQPKADIFAQLSWILAHKYRKLMIAILLLLIFALSSFAYLRYISMQKDLKSLKAFEPVFVLKLNRDLNVGEALRLDDLSIGRVFRQEFEELKTQLPGEDLDRSSLFECKTELNLSSCPNLINRVVKIPVYKGSILRHEMLAQAGIEPGIVNLLAKDEAFLDVTVPQTGFNVYLKPDDLVDVYRVDRDATELIAKKAKIIMIDAMSLGKAPMQVRVDPSLLRNLTLAVKKDNLFKLTNAVKSKKTYITLHNFKEELAPQVAVAKKSKPRSFFQSLTLIQGNKKEILQK